MGSARLVTPGFFPLDEELALLPGDLTPRLQEALVRLSTWIPSFAKAAAELAWFTQVDVHRETARRLTEGAGATAVALHDAEVVRLAQTLPDPPAGPDTLVFSVDGAMVPLVHGQWAEARTLAVGEVLPVRPTADGPVIQTTNLSYYSRLTDSTTFADLALPELHRRGIERAGRVGAVVDGAEWCQSFIDLHYAEAVRILDFAHAAEYVSAMAQTSGPAGAVLADTERVRLLHDLKHTDPDAVLADLRALVAAHPTLAELPKQLAYLEKRVAQLQYPQFVAAGWPIGSGMVESANKLVVEDRLKGAGMHWSEPNVTPMLALRNAVCNDRWDEVWTRIEDAQRRQVVVRRAMRRQQRQPTSAAIPRPRTAAPARPAQPTPPPAPAPADGPRASDVTQPAVRRPAADHPWKRAWSVRRQREQAGAA